MLPRLLRRPAGRRTAVARPAAHVAESLEARALLTTFVVDSVADVVAADGETTLREALLAAETGAPVGDAEAGDAEGDRITFDLPGGTGGTIFLTDALPQLKDDLRIDGGEVVTLTAAAGETIFESVSTEIFAFSNLTLTFGTADRGGAMTIEGGATVTFEEMTFGANVSEGDGGGAVYVTGDSTLDITGGMFQGNSAAGDDGDGGAILIEGGSLNVDGTEFMNNTALGGDSDEGGGAIFAESGAVVAVTNAEFDGNAAGGDSGSGGAIHIRGGSLDVTDTLFNDNAAVRAGGAIETADGTEATIADSRFTRNVAGTDEDGEEGVEVGNPGNGGALHVSGSGATADVANTYFALNQAANQGGALWNADDSEMRVDGSVFSTNTASGGDSGDGGGAIYDQGDGLLTVTGSQFFRNAADGGSGSGGGLLTAGGNARITGSVFNMNSAPRAGGAIEIGTGFVAIDGARFTRNLAGGETGDGEEGGETGDLEGNPGNGGAIHVTGDAVTRVDGGAFALNDAANEGGGLWNSSGGDMTVSNVSVARNRASGDDADSGGGGFYNDGGTLRIRNVFVSGNTAIGESGSGGGLLSTGGAVLVNDSNFNMNSARRAGGGIELVDGDLRFTDSFLRNNFAGAGDSGNPGNGGGYHATGQALAVFSGGGAFRNVADDEGGGFWNQDDARLVLTDGVRVRDNIAAVGGGVYNNSGRFDLRDGSRLSNNEARGGDGGGLFNAGDGNAYLDDSRVTGNAADGTGGGAFTESDAATFLRDAVFAANDPNDADGPGMYVGDSGSLDRDGTGGDGDGMDGDGDGMDGDGDGMDGDGDGMDGDGGTMA